LKRSIEGGSPQTLALFAKKWNVSATSAAERERGGVVQAFKLRIVFESRL
jgi:hypothetical protein